MPTCDAKLGVLHALHHARHVAFIMSARCEAASPCNVCCMSLCAHHFQLAIYGSSVAFRQSASFQTPLMVCLHLGWLEEHVIRHLSGVFSSSFALRLVRASAQVAQATLDQIAILGAQASHLF